MTEHLASKCDAPSSNWNTTTTNKKKPPQAKNSALNFLIVEKKLGLLN
jgi:hypothetical protein